MADPTLQLPHPLAERIDALGLEFLAHFYEIETVRRPDNVEALAELGHVYTRQHRYAEGLAIDCALARLAPLNPTVHYNLACSHALLGNVDEALAALEHAIELGYDDAGFMLVDDDLATLRDEPRFKALVARLGPKTGSNRRES